jgi:hypothetical protein
MWPFSNVQWWIVGFYSTYRLIWMGLVVGSVTHDPINACQQSKRVQMANRQSICSHVVMEYRMQLKGSPPKIPHTTSMTHPSAGTNKTRQGTQTIQVIRTPQSKLILLWKVRNLQYMIKEYLPLTIPGIIELMHHLLQHRIPLTRSQEYRLVWATELSLAAIGLVFPFGNTNSLIVQCIKYQFLPYLVNLYDYILNSYY